MVTVQEWNFTWPLLSPGATLDQIWFSEFNKYLLKGNQLFSLRGFLALKMY